VTVSRQTRRTVSIKGATYAKLRAYSEARGESMSQSVERMIASAIVDQELIMLDRQAEVYVPMPEPTPVGTKRVGEEKLW
jgi:hypothetical protein